MSTRTGGVSAPTRRLARAVGENLRALPIQPLGNYRLALIEMDAPWDARSGIHACSWEDGPSTREALAALCVAAPGVLDADGAEVMLAQLLTYRRRLSVAAVLTSILAREQDPRGGETETWDEETQASTSLTGLSVEAWRQGEAHLEVMHSLLDERLRVRAARTPGDLGDLPFDELDEQVRRGLLGEYLDLARNVLAR